MPLQSFKFCWICYNTETKDFCYIITFCTFFFFSLDWCRTILQYCWTFYQYHICFFGRKKKMAFISCFYILHIWKKRLQGYKNPNSKKNGCLITPPSPDIYLKHFLLFSGNYSFLFVCLVLGLLQYFSGEGIFLVDLWTSYWQQLSE